MTDTPPPTLLFLHVPKTAGISLAGALARRLSPDQTFHVRDGRNPRAPVHSTWHGPESALRALPEAQRARFRLVAGHFPFGLHEHLPGPCLYATLLREPVARVLSHFSQYNRGRRRQGEPTSSLGEWCERYPGALENHQTRWFAGALERPLREGDVERALDALEKHFAVVGTTERLSQTVALIEGMRGWGPLELRAKNVADERPGPDDLDPLLLERIRRSNALDARLHEYAKRRLEDDLASREVNANG